MWWCCGAERKRLAQRRLAMDREDVFAAWVPPDDAWSLWARPVLFAQMPVATDAAREPPSPRLDVSWLPGAAAAMALVIDLPAAASVWMGLAAAEKGYRPVPLYNGCTGPHEVIPQGEIIAALRAGAGVLAQQQLSGAPPAFLLDADRARPARPIQPGDFDNRWQIFPEDLPSPAVLRERGLTEVLLIQRGATKP